MTERGRPTKYRGEYAEQAFRLCLLGLNDQELADFFQVHIDTIHEWKGVHEDFSDALTRGKLDADGRVAAAFFKRAVGYSHDAVKIFMPQGASAPVYADYVEHYPPDTPAIKSWLSNRQRGRWKMSDTAIETGDNTVITIVNAPEGE